MYLGEACRHIGCDHSTGFVHRFGSRKVRPGVGTQMIAAQDQPGRIETFLLSDAQDEGPKVGRGHARVATFVVHLIARRLDQNRHRPVTAHGKGNANDHRMRRTHRRYAPDFAGFPIARQMVERSGQHGKDGPS